jgi:hypothetical protein
MRSRERLRPTLRQQASDVLRRLPPAQREALLIKCWMSHDARWFMAVAGEYGMEAANRLNRVAAHEVGKAEARRIARAVELPAAKTVDDWLLTQETILGLVGPDLVDYRVTKAGTNTFHIDVQRCFAYENAVRAGISDHYECGIFARITGWFDAQGLSYEISLSLGKCLKTAGEGCLYRFTLTFDAEGGDQGNGRVEQPDGRTGRGVEKEQSG